MGKFAKSISIILCSLALSVFPVIAPASAKGVALSRDNISRFLASFQEMRSIVVSEGLRAGMDPEAVTNPIGALIKAIKSSKLQTQAKTIATSHGFADLKDWFDTGKAIGQAYLYVKTGPGRGIARDTLEKNKERAIDGLEKLGLLNEKQKEKLRENLDNISQQLASEIARQTQQHQGHGRDDCQRDFC